MRYVVVAGDRPTVAIGPAGSVFQFSVAMSGAIPTRRVVIRTGLLLTRMTVFVVREAVLVAVRPDRWDASQERHCA